MKIHYLNGTRLYYAFLAGGNAVIDDQVYLNKINVFPIPDADTGTNLATTMRAIADGSEAHRSIRTTLKSIANAALSGARGNSGLIFAQFIQGLSQEIHQETKLTTRAFGESVRRAVHHAHKAIVSPVEGTMITVIRDWAEAVYSRRTQTSDFVELLAGAMPVAQESLRETPRKLPVLAKAGVVDAGAKGFVDFLEGILQFIRKGKLGRMTKSEASWVPEEIRVPSKEKSLTYRYCCEALLGGRSMDADSIRSEVGEFGGSVVVAGTDEKVRIHVHTNNPAELFFKLKDRGTVTQIKVDDNRRLYEAAHERKAEIAIVTDSSCDLPPEILEERQVYVIPFPLSFGEQQFLDKVTIAPSQFYDLLRTDPAQPKTGQPSWQSIHHFLSFLAGCYKSVIFLTLSSKLSGFHSLCLKAAEKLSSGKITVIDSRTISVGLALLVDMASEMALAGASHEKIVEAVGAAIPRAKILVDVSTMKYFVRSGRVKPLKGLVGRLLKLKPILELDPDGSAVGVGKSFLRKTNIAKILGMIEAEAETRKVRAYAIVHAQNPERAELYRQKMRALLGSEPAYILGVAPVIGAHAGIGAVAAAVLFDQ